VGPESRTSASPGPGQPPSTGSDERLFVHTNGLIHALNYTAISCVCGGSDGIFLAGWSPGYSLVSDAIQKHQGVGATPLLSGLSCHQ